MKKSIKSIIAVCIAVVLVGTVFAACSSSNSETNGTYKVGIAQWEDHPALNDATEGFKKALQDKLGEDKVEFEYNTAQGEVTNCSTIVNRYATNKVDLIMANATPVVQAAVSATKEIPIVGTSVTEYGVALGIDNFSGKTGTNVTGTSDLAPLDQQAAMIKEIAPEIKTVGIIYCSGEANSKYQATEVAKYLAESGITFQRLYLKMMQSMFLQTIQLQRIQELLMQLQDLLKSLFLQAKRVSQRAAVSLPLQSAIMISDMQQAKWLPIFFRTEQTLLKWKSDTLRNSQKNIMLKSARSLELMFQPIMLLLTQQHNCFKI